MSAPPPAADNSCNEEVEFTYDMAETTKSAKEVETAKPVEPKVVEKKDADPEQALSSAPYAKQMPAEDTDSDSEYTYEPGIITKRCCCWCCLIIALIAAVICALYFTVGPERAQEVVQGITLTESPTMSPTTLAPTVSPTAAPTSQLFADIVDLLTPFTPEETLLDSETPQGQALRQLVAEVEVSGGEPVPHRTLQRYGLMTLYLSTAPEGWKTSFGWNDFGEDECEWYGIGTCRFLADGTYGVANIELDNNALSGPLPSEICALAENLASIDLSSNALERSIPACLKDFVELSEVNLSNNNLTGELPTGLLGIPTMSQIDFSENDLEGDAASLFGDDVAATGLTSVNLSNNRLTGDFPPTVSSFASLATLQLHGNEMNGEVPAEVCNVQGVNTFLTTLTADCVELYCTCCTTCF